MANKRFVDTTWGKRRQYCNCDTGYDEHGSGGESPWNIASRICKDASENFTAGSADKLCDVCYLYPWTFRRLEDEKQWKIEAGYIPIKERGSKT
jgi:hypothetical protein